MTGVQTCALPIWLIEDLPLTREEKDGILGEYARTLLELNQEAYHAH